jgi:hypothetical protein
MSPELEALDAGGGVAGGLESAGAAEAVPAAALDDAVESSPLGFEVEVSSSSFGFGVPPPQAMQKRGTARAMAASERAAAARGDMGPPWEGGRVTQDRVRWRIAEIADLMKTVTTPGRGPG